MNAKRKKPAQGPEAMRAALDRWAELCDRLGPNHPETEGAHAAVLDAMPPEARTRIDALTAEMIQTARALFGDPTMH